jgi:nuclear pore complex protein Nup93
MAQPKLNLMGGLGAASPKLGAGVGGLGAAPKLGAGLGGLGGAAPKLGAGLGGLGGAAPKLGAGVGGLGGAAPKLGVGAGGLGGAAPKLGVGVGGLGGAAPKLGVAGLGGAAPKLGVSGLGGAAPKLGVAGLGGVAPKLGAGVAAGQGAAPQVGGAAPGAAPAQQQAGQEGAARPTLSVRPAAGGPPPEKKAKSKAESQWDELLSQAQRLTGTGGVAGGLGAPAMGQLSSTAASGFTFEARDPTQLRDHAAQLRERHAEHAQFAGAGGAADAVGFTFGGLGGDTNALLASGTGGFGNAAEIAARTRAHSLLATKGFDAERLGRNLGGLTLRARFEPTEPRAEADLEGFLRDEHDAIVLSTINETRQETAQRFEQAQEELIMEDWEESKRAVIDQLQGRLPLGLTPGVGPRQKEGPALAGNDPSQQLLEDLLGQPVVAPMAGLAGQYAAVVHSLHEHSLRNEPFPLVSSLAGATIAARSGSDLTHAREAARAEGLAQSWDLIAEIVGEQTDASPPAGVFLRGWNGGADSQAEVLSRLLRGCQAFLESQYADYVKKTVREKPDIANLGPNPGDSGLYRGFLRVLYAGNGDWPQELAVVGDIPVWACVFLCLRCGESARSLDGLIDEIESRGGETILGNFSNYARLFAQSIRNGESPGFIDSQHASSLTQDYEQVISSATSDPFEVLCYHIVGNNIIGEMDPRRSFSDVLTTTQDFLWYKILRVRVGGLNAITGPADSKRPTLVQLQQVLKEYGPNHFSLGGQNPLLYFQVLLLSCQFDEAISWLAGLPQFHAEAAHAALALYHYGLCDGDDPSQDGSDSLRHAEDRDVFDGAGVLERTILAYAIALAAPSRGVASTEHALEYMSLIRDPRRRARALALVLVQGDASTVSAVLGDPAQDTRGIFETLGFSAAETAEIVRLAAGSHEVTGRHADAVRLYEHAGDAIRVWEILTAQLSGTLAQPSSQNSERDVMADLAMQIYKKHRDAETPSEVAAVSDPARVQSAWFTLELSLNLVFFFDLYHENQFDAAVQLMEELDLLPLRLRDTVDLQNKLDQFKTLDHAIRRNIGEVLVATMDSLRLSLLSLRERYPADPADAESAELVREQAKSVLSFSGLLAQRLPDDIQSRLMRLWVGMA